MECTVPETGPRIPYSHELVQRTEVERHLRNAPAPIPDPGPASVPQILGIGPRKRGRKDLTRLKEFRNYGHVIPRTDHYTEYPTMEYPYHNQTARSGGFVPQKTPKGKTIMTAVDPGYVRTITDDKKHVQAVLYHPLSEHEVAVPPNSNISPEPVPRASGALYPSQEVFRAQTFGPRQTFGLPVSRG